MYILGQKLLEQVFHVNFLLNFVEDDKAFGILWTHKDFEFIKFLNDTISLLHLS